MSAKDALPYQPLILSKDKPKDLLAALKNTNLFWRSHAQRLLVERNQKDIVPELLTLIRDNSVDEIGINAAAIHALWILKGLSERIPTENAIEGDALKAVFEATKHPSSGVRKVAIQVLPRNKESLDFIFKNNILDDKEPLVVLNTLLAISEMPLDEASENLILQKLEKSKDINDRWLPDAFACILSKNEGKLLKKVLNVQITKAVKTPVANDAHSGHHDHNMMPKEEKKVETTDSKNAPDLIITKINTTPANPAARERVVVTIEVKNQGGVDIPKGVTVPLDLRFSGNGETVDVVSRTHTEGVKAGETVTITHNTNGPWTGPIGFSSELAGEYTLSVVVDKANDIKEGVETNNRSIKKITFTVPQSMTQYVMEKSIRSLASKASVKEVIGYLRDGQKLSSEGYASVLKAISEGWNYKRKVEVMDIDKTDLSNMLLTSTGTNKDRLKRLMESWGVLENKEINDPSVQTIKMKSVREMLQFDIKTFTVKAGKTVEIVFENPDAMQHNIIIGKPKSLEKIGKAADKMITDPDGAAKNYVPNSPDILFASALVNPDQTIKLRFTAPAKAGNYPYLCTFPGHWRIMNGVMKVE